ncbi:MAG: chemotaxis protein CheW [Desulforegulaceae bacterium]|jgi:purine-binding chemotaxis protein CheW|nr:chemotaxis protein CheW [Desulforegulaceae bacterium]
MGKTQSKEYLIFQLMDEKFAVLSEKTLEIVQSKRITKLPKMPDFFLGIMNLRGNLFPAVDLRLIFNMPYQEDTKETVFIVVSVNKDEPSYEAAFRVDKVCEVETISNLKIMPYPESGSLIPEKYLFGSFHYKDQVVLILSPDVLFSRQELGLA